MWEGSGLVASYTFRINCVRTQIRDYNYLSINLPTKLKSSVQLNRKCTTGKQRVCLLLFAHHSESETFEKTLQPQYSVCFAHRRLRRVPAHHVLFAAASGSEQLSMLVYDMREWPRARHGRTHFAWVTCRWSRPARAPIKRALCKQRKPNTHIFILDQRTRVYVVLRSAPRAWTNTHTN